MYYYTIRKSTLHFKSSIEVYKVDRISDYSLPQAHFNVWFTTLIMKPCTTRDVDKSRQLGC